MNTTLDHLVAARDLISKPEKWCQHLQVDSQGRHCALGALNRAISGRVESKAYGQDIIDLLCNMMRPQERARAKERLQRLWNVRLEGNRPSHVAQFNNTHTHGEVLALFDRAIARQRLVVELMHVKAKDGEPKTQTQTHAGTV